MRILRIVALGAALSGCAIQRAQIAQDAQSNMIGMPKEQVLACMGPPANKATEGKTEVWAYSTSPTINLDRGSGATRFCNINVTMNGGNVSAVNYQGPRRPALAGRTMRLCCRSVFEAPFVIARVVKRRRSEGEIDVTRL
jgi:hypothetical protein